MAAKTVRSKMTYGAGWAVGLLAIMLAVIMVIVSGIGSSVAGKWFKNPFFDKWFNCWGKGDPDKGDDGFVVTPTSEYSFMLLTANAEGEPTQSAVSEQNNVRIVTAQVIDNITGEPVEELQDVTFTLEFQNENPDRVAPVDYYVGMEVDGMTAKLTCYNAFPEPIKLTCTSNIDPTKYATAKLNYYKRIAGVYVNLDGTEQLIDDVTGNQDCTYGDLTLGYYTKLSDVPTDKNMCLLKRLKEGVGTIGEYMANPSWTSGGSFSISYTPEFKAYVKEKMGISLYYMPLIYSGSEQNRLSHNVSVYDILQLTTNGSIIGDRLGEFMRCLNSYDGEGTIQISLSFNISDVAALLPIERTFRYTIHLKIPVDVGDVKLDPPDIQF